VDCLNVVQIEDDENWMFIGDFNFYRLLDNRNKDGRSMQDIMVFNSIISNMQQEYLLEQLDWCFTSTNWTSDYPNTLMIPMAIVTSDHIPHVIRAP
jgi:endonuclease/exonuclease/phosphatase family metal-dependent hydrolase